VAIYLKLGSIAGSVTVQGFESWIALDSFKWSFNANVAQGHGGANVTANEVVVTMRMEKASTAIVNAGVNRTVLKPKVQIQFTTTGKNTMDQFLGYELEGCLISKYSVDGAKDDPPTETLTLNFTKIIETYTSRDAKLTGAKSTVTYDVTQGSAT